MPYEPDPLLPVAANLKRAREHVEMLQHSYARTVILLADEPFGLEPSDYASREGLSDEIDSRNVLSFNPPAPLLRALKTLFPTCEIHHSMTPVLRWLRADVLGHAADVNSPAVFFCNFHEKQVEVCCHRGQQLLLVNRFENRRAVDTAYYLLGTWQTLALDQQRDVLCIAGSASDMRELRDQLSRFVAHIELLNPAEIFHGCELARLESVPFDIRTFVSIPY